MSDAVSEQWLRAARVERFCEWVVVAMGASGGVCGQCELWGRIVIVMGDKSCREGTVEDASSGMEW